MIHVVTITQSDGLMVRVIPVDADDIIDACVRAARFLPFVTGWTAVAEAQSNADCIEHADLFEKLVNDAFVELCDKSEGNSYVDDDAFIDGVDEYFHAHDAVYAINNECNECGGAIVGGCCDNCMGADV